MKLLFLAASFAVAASHVDAAVLDSFTMDAPSFSSGVLSNIMLAAGVTYKIVILGTFDIGCIGGVGQCPTDAEYYTPLSGGNAGNHYDLTGFDAPGGVDISALVDGVNIDWGPYNPAHVYSTLFSSALTQQVRISYLDTNYGDNVGSLQVRIESLAAAVPLPAGLPLALTGIGALAFVRRRKQRHA